MAEVPMALIGYYPVSHSVKGLLRERNEMESHIRFTDEPPASPLGAGWYFDDASFRSIQPKAELTLRRPAGSGEFEVVAFLPPHSLPKDGASRVTVLEDGRSLGTEVLSETGAQPQVLRWKLAGASAGIHKIAILAEPVRHIAGDPRDLGIVVSAIGYVSR